LVNRPIFPVEQKNQYAARESCCAGCFNVAGVFRLVKSGMVFHASEGAGNDFSELPAGAFISRNSKNAALPGKNSVPLTNSGTP
ncbi:MAG: hypothetical protein RLO18_28705, partial [Gimesia chilikensis]